MNISISAFRPVPRTGVIFVNAEAAKHGFHTHSPEWSNLGQGQPETGPLPGSPLRISDVTIHPDDHEYAPVPGLWEVRQAIADLYNHLYRQGKKSQYTAENVAICGGGRMALTRVVAALGQVNLGHFLPDYTAYEELLDVFRLFTPIPILLEGQRGYSFSIDELRREILGRGLGALLLSNPCNPTGKVIANSELDAWVKTARELDCALVIDEFYSNYIWVGKDQGKSVSAAAYVDDVDRDPVVLLNGLTKNWRYPGWRLSWTVGPRAVIDAVASAGSFLDGGGTRPLQRAVLPILKAEYVVQETRAIYETFSHKRQLLIEGLERLGITLDISPQGTFYAWGNLSNLPGKFSDGMEFFREALKHKVIVVPGEFFDINPGKRRPGRTSRFRQYARFSFGPTMDTVKQGLERLGTMLHG
jgi:N-succinyldiaminopimelate aminotransferase